MAAYGGINAQSATDSLVGADVPPRHAWGLVVLITLLSILSLLDRNIISLFMDDIKAELAIDDVQAGFIYGGAFAITFSLMGLPVGWAVDRFSRRKIIFAGVSLWSVATTACAFASTFPVMVVARGLVGAGEAALVPSAQSIIADNFPPHRRTLPLSFYAMGQKAGAGIALLIGGALTAVFVPGTVYSLGGMVSLRGWQTILVVIGLPGIVIACLIFLFAEPRRSFVGGHHARASTYRRYFAFMVANRGYFIGHHFGFVAWQSILTAVLSWTPSFLIRTHGWTPSQVGLWFGTIILVGPLLGLPAHGWICDRFLARGVRDVHLRYQLITLPFGLAPLVAAYFVPDAILGLVLLGLGLTLTAGTGAATAASLQLAVGGADRGKAASVWLLVGGLASFVGPSGAALLNQQFFGSPATIGYGVAVYVGVAIVLATALFAIAWLSFRHIGDNARSADEAPFR